MSPYSDLWCPTLSKQCNSEGNTVVMDHFHTKLLHSTLLSIWWYILLEFCLYTKAEIWSESEVYLHITDALFPLQGNNN